MDNAISSDSRVNEAAAPVIAVIAPNPDPPGGQAVQARELMAGLRKEGFPVVFIPINPRFPGALLWLRRVPLLRTLLNQLLYVISLFKLKSVDVVHVYSASYWSFLLAPAPAIFFARLFKKPVVLNYHSGEAQDHLQNWGRRVHPWLKRVDEIVVPSPYLQQVFEGFGYKSRVILNVVCTEGFKFRLRRPFKPNLLSNRNLEPLYDVENSLKAFAILRESYPHATMTVAGFGSQEKNLKQLVASLKIDKVSFVGRVNSKDMPALFDKADVFVNSSTIDNQPVSILEAFAAGCVVVSTPTGDIPAMMNNETAGMLVPHKNPQAMAAAIGDLLKNQAQAQSFVLKAMEDIKSYSWQAVKDQWRDLYFMQQK